VKPDPIHPAGKQNKHCNSGGNPYKPRPSAEDLADQVAAVLAKSGTLEFFISHLLILA
jgi:hypothetical protein